MIGLKTARQCTAAPTRNLQPWPTQPMTSHHHPELVSSSNRLCYKLLISFFSIKQSSSLLYLPMVCPWFNVPNNSFLLAKKLILKANIIWWLEVGSRRPPTTPRLMNKKVPISTELLELTAFSPTLELELNFSPGFWAPFCVLSSLRIIWHLF